MFSWKATSASRRCPTCSKKCQSLIIYISVYVCIVNIGLFLIIAFVTLFFFFNVLNDWMHFNLATVLLQHIHMWIAWNAWSTERSGFLNKPVPLSVTVSRFPLESFPLGFGDVWAEATMLYCRWSQLLLLSAVFLCSEGGKGCAFLAENRTTGMG